MLDYGAVGGTVARQHGPWIGHRPRPRPPTKYEYRGCDHALLKRCESRVPGGMLQMMPFRGALIMEAAAWKVDTREEPVRKAASDSGFTQRRAR